VGALQRREHLARTTDDVRTPGLMAAAVAWIDQREPRGRVPLVDRRGANLGVSDVAVVDVEPYRGEASLPHGGETR
jgi:hypothetical protein